MTPERVAEILDLDVGEVREAEDGDVDWDDGGRWGNWRHYVPDALKPCWPSLPVEMRMVIRRMADDAAKADQE